jgi:hypothetical protein
MESLSVSLCGRDERENGKVFASIYDSRCRSKRGEPDEGNKSKRWPRLVNNESENVIKNP